LSLSYPQPALLRAMPKLAIASVLVTVAAAGVHLLVGSGEPEPSTQVGVSYWQTVEQEPQKAVHPGAPKTSLRVRSPEQRMLSGQEAVPQQSTWVSRTEASIPAQAWQHSVAPVSSQPASYRPPTYGGIAVWRPHEARGPVGGFVTAVQCTSDGGSMRCGECQTDSDCPVGKGCVPDGQTQRMECVASECQEDLDCLTGEVCRPVTLGNAGPMIRRCAEAGERRLGEACTLLFSSKAESCEEGLVCHRGVCSTPCSLENASSCPEGFSCEEGTDGPACFGDCRVQGCAQGQQCKRLNETKYQCLESVQGECPEKACGEGQRCNARVAQGQGVFWCAQLCNPLQPDSCPAGEVCGMGAPTVSTCFRKCDPGAVPDTCGEGWQCVSVSEDFRQFGCRPVPQTSSVSSMMQP
jgi:hypothetical protein